MTHQSKKSSNLTKQSVGFTQISNELVNDIRISLKAKGLYLYLFSKPNNWQFYQKNIIRKLKESRKAFDNAVKELENFGWLERIRKKGNDGRFLNYDYYLKTSVQKDALDKSTSVPFTAVDNSNVEKGADNNNTDLLNNTKSINKKKKSQKTKLLKDFSLKKETIKTLKDEGYSEEQINKTIISFKDYWLNGDGKGKKKVNWQTAFRLWIRKSKPWGKNQNHFKTSEDVLFKRFEREDRERENGN